MTTSAGPVACHQIVDVGDQKAKSANTCSAAIVTYVVVDSVAPVPRGARAASAALPRVVSNSECASGNWISRAALAIQFHGVGTVPSDRLMPKNIATIMVRTPSRNDTWHTRP